MFFNLCTSLVKLFHQENNFIDKPRHQELKILETVLALSGHDLLLTKHFLMNNGRKKKKTDPGENSQSYHPSIHFLNNLTIYY